MKRRSILKSALAVPAAAALPAQAQAQQADQSPAVATTGPESVADGVPRFFTPPQLAALRRLGDAIAPAGAGRVSASQAGVAEFLDFLVRESPAPLQKLYRDGLDKLAAAGDNIQPLLAPLKSKWTYKGPADPFARFLEQAKSDILQATSNSREQAEAGGRGRRGSGGMTNYFWRAVE
jgi:hypothetical protein